MRFVMVTGMSGGGKSTAMRLLEDMGYYCVDNLPVLLIDKFVELLATPNTEITKAALGVDVRTDQSFAETELKTKRHGIRGAFYGRIGRRFGKAL